MKLGTETETKDLLERFLVFTTVHLSSTYTTRHSGECGGPQIPRC